jgi:hypothetical protein
MPGTSSSVPLFSGSQYEGLWLSAFIWGFVLSFFLYATQIAIDIPEWLAVTIVAGLVVQFGSAVFKKRRFYNPVINEDIIALFQAATDDVGRGKEIQLWFRDIDRGILLSAANILFKAMLLSGSTIQDILSKGEKGKVILAKEILSVERINPISRVAIGLLWFILISLFESASIGGPAESALLSIFSMGPIVMVFFIVAVLAALLLIPFTQCRSNDKIDQVIEELYGTHPEAARIEVLTGLKVPTELLEAASREQEEATPSSRRTALIKSSALGTVASLVSFVVFYFTFPYPVFSMIFSALMSIIVGAGAFAIAFMIIVMWPIIGPSGKRSNEWDIHVPFVADVQLFLNRFLDPKKVAIRAVKPPFDDDYGLVVVTLHDNHEEKVLFSLMPAVLKDIHDPELAGSLILSEIRREDIKKRYNRISYIFLGPAMIILIGGMVSSFMLLGFEGFFAMLIPIFFMYFIVGIAPAAYMSHWKRNAEAKSDEGVARECSRFTEALQILIDKHHTLPYGITSYRTRLERISRLVGPAQGTQAWDE